MESQPQNPEFRNNPENFHPFKYNEAYLLLYVDLAHLYHQDQYQHRKKPV